VAPPAGGLLKRYANGPPRLVAIGPGTVSRRQPPILNILVPHTGHVPWVAGFPFFIVIFCSFDMSRFALHFTQ
jgi:hypothetical protein